MAHGTLWKKDLIETIAVSVRNKFCLILVRLLFFHWC